MNRKICSAAAALLMLVACSPGLNWRQVPVAQLAALLPCKPDHAERQVELLGAKHPMAMWGCEAGRNLFAVSYMPVSAGTSSDALMQAWQVAALRNVGAGQPVQLGFKAPSLRNGNAMPGSMIRVNGKQTDGQAVQAQLAWFTADGVIYHLAVYGPQLSPAELEPFFTEMHWL